MNLSIFTKIAKILSTIVITIVIATFILFSSILIWVSTGPHHINNLTTLLIERVNHLLPQMSISLEDITIDWDKNDNDIVISFQDIKATNQQDIEFHITAINTKINLLGLLPYTDYTLFNIDISSSEVDTITNEARQRYHSIPNLDIEKINSYIQRHNHSLWTKVSINITNTPFYWNDNSGQNNMLLIEHLKIKPRVRHEEMTFRLMLDAKLNNEKFYINTNLDTTSGKFLEFNGIANDLSFYVIDKLLDSKFEGIHSKANIRFSGHLSNFNKIDKVNFLIESKESYIDNKNIFMAPIEINSMAIQGTCIHNCSAINLDDIVIETADNNKIAGSVIYAGDILTASVHTKNLDQDTIYKIWPVKLAPRVRQWLEQNINYADIKSATLTLNLNVEQIKQGIIKIHHDDIKAEFKLKKAIVTYLDPNLNLKNIDIDISGDDIKIYAEHGTILGSKISSLNAAIDNLGGKNSTLSIKSDAEGSISEAITIALAYTKTKNDFLSNFSGVAKSSVNIFIPFNNVLDTDVMVDMQIYDLKKKKIFGDYDLDVGSFKLNCNKKQLKATGQGMVNSIVPVDFVIKNDFITKEANIDILSNSNVRTLRDANFNIPKIIDGNLAINLNISILDHKIKRQDFNIDLLNSYIDIPVLGIKKHIGTNAMIKGNFLIKGKALNLNYYYLKFPQLQSKGSAIISYDRISYAKSDNTVFNRGRFNFNYKNIGNEIIMHIGGESFDLNSITHLTTQMIDNNKFTNLDLTTNLQTIYLKNHYELLAPIVTIRSKKNKLQELIVKGQFDSSDSLDIAYIAPNVNVVINNAGKALTAFDIYPHMNQGNLTFSGGFNSDDILAGNLSIDHYYITKTPILAKFLTIVAATSTSFIGIADLLQGKGIRFNNLTCPIHYEDMVVSLDKCSAVGAVMTMKGSGNVNIKKRYTNIIGTIIPTNIINSLISKLPGIGEAVSEGKDKGLISTRYEIRGDFNDDLSIKIKSH